MKVNILIGGPDQKWILGRLARELQTRNGWTINEKGADIDYCLPYLMYSQAHARIKIPLFTHKEDNIGNMGGKIKSFDRVSSKCQASISLSENTKKLLPWETQQNSYVIHLGTDLKRVVNFGVVGKNHRSGRKNFDWLKALKVDFSIIEVLLGEDRTEREEFYRYIDYLIVTSSVEGGPVPVLDALAMGVPVIAGDVGWCWEFPCIKYEADNFDSLKDVLTKLSVSRTWQEVAEDHMKVFKEIYEKSK